MFVAKRVTFSEEKQPCGNCVEGEETLSTQSNPVGNVNQDNAMGPIIQVRSAPVVNLHDQMHGC